MLNFHFNLWDFLMLALITSMGVITAYIRQPKWKAFMLAVPIPFTLATLSLGRRVDASTIGGLLLAIGYMHSVRALYRKVGVPIVLAIVISAAGYCLIGGFFSTLIPADDTAFWISCAIAVVLALILFIKTPHIDEPGYRSPLPLWVKAPATCLTILILILLKNALQGFMAMFPFVGVIVTYESRHSLWAVCRQVHVVPLYFIPMAIVCRYLQPSMGGWALIPTLVTYGIMATIVTKALWAKSASGQGGRVILNKVKDLAVDP